MRELKLNQSLSNIVKFVRRTLPRVRELKRMAQKLYGVNKPSRTLPRVRELKPCWYLSW